MQHALQFLVYIVFVILPHHLLANVDLKSGNFFHTWIDAEITQPDFHFQLTRTYNSLDPQVGIFGKGFCSKLETKLAIHQDQSLSIQNCGAGETTHYQKSGQNWIYQDQIISLSGTHYVLKVGNRTQLQFNLNGTLDAFWVFNEKASITYRGDKIESVNTPTVRMKFEYQNQLVQRIILNTETIQYTYTGDMLSETQNQWKNKYHYHYDNKGLLKRIEWSDHTETLITYDPRRSWVSSVVDRNHCKDSYSFRVNQESSLSVQTSQHRRSCPGQDDSNVEYIVKIRDKGQIDSVRRSFNKSWSLITYNDLGRPKEFSDSDQNHKSFEYESDGALKSVRSNQMKTDLRWNSVRQLASIKSSDEIFEMTYDSNARVNTVTTKKDSQQVKLVLSYFGNSENIEAIEQIGLGKLTYIQKENGILEAKTTPTSKTLDPESVRDSIQSSYARFILKTDIASLIGGLE
jgi:hypothetical protein